MVGKFGFFSPEKELQYQQVHLSKPLVRVLMRGSYSLKSVWPAECERADNGQTASERAEERERERGRGWLAVAVLHGWLVAIETSEQSVNLIQYLQNESGVAGRREEQGKRRGGKRKEGRVTSTGLRGITEERELMCNDCRPLRFAELSSSWMIKNFHFFGGGRSNIVGEFKCVRRRNKAVRVPLQRNFFCAKAAAARFY